MKTILLLAGRELRAFFDTAWGWTILATVLVLDGLMFNAFALGTRERYSADVLADFFYLSAGTTMIAGILLTMRLIAEERQTGTLVLLQTAPIRAVDIVLGKFLGAFGFLSSSSREMMFMGFDILAKLLPVSVYMQLLST